MRVVVGLGSNLGSRWSLVTAAMDELERRFGEAKRSSYVRTPAMTWEGAPPGPDYINAAMSFECTWSLVDLLEYTQSLEDLFGRKRGERWGNRTLDIDILWAPMSCDAPRVPHPGFFDRDFALGPALQVDASLRADCGERLAELGGMPAVVLPPIIERTPDRICVRRALDASDALAVAWGATATNAGSDVGWVTASPSTPLSAASACIDTTEAHLIRPSDGEWTVESHAESSCVLKIRHRRI